MIDELGTYPELTKIIELVSAQNPLQRKRIRAFISQQDIDYWTFAENLSRTLNQSFLQSDKKRNDAAQSYNRMCMEILREQIRFRKTGIYLLDDASAAEQAVYSQHDAMRSYIIGLLLSYLLWPNHYRMFQFYAEHVATLQAKTCLEVGVGHGLFSVELMQRLPEIDLTLVDISAASLELAREILTAFRLDQKQIRFIHGDYLTWPLASDTFDFLIMGEVLEHVNDAPNFLKRAWQLLRPGGSIFLSTCVNCPAIDHVYHFHSVDEIRELIKSADLSIASELVLPAEAVPEEYWQAELVTINYCAILTRQ